MKIKPISFLFICLSALLMSCGGDSGKVVYRTRLDGYQGKKLRIKLDETLTEVKLENGEDGYLLTTDVQYSEGRSNRMATLTKTWMHKNYEMVRKENKTFKSDEVTKDEHLVVRDGKVVLTNFVDGKPQAEEVFEWDRDTPIFSEPVPLQYMTDLPNPGDTKAYWIFYDLMRASAPVRVKNREKTTVTLGDKQIECMRYSVRSMTSGGHYNDYYLALDDHRVVKIVVANIEFVPPGTPR